MKAFSSALNQTYQTPAPRVSSALKVIRHLRVLGEDELGEVVCEVARAPAWFRGMRQRIRQC